MKKNYNAPEIKVFKVTLENDIIQTSGIVVTAEAPMIYDNSVALSEQTIDVFN